ncbi:hypothetical protein [Methylobacterium sp. sgz302541]|uniref:hypothetical protein n=1 Tax=unclassified Methylobacterium TaxID=2615210 RepID=UPI003D33F94D
MPKLLSGLAATAACLVATVALAQNPDVPLKGRDSDPALPPPSQTPPDRIKPGAGGEAAPDGSLSDRLEKSDGVIKPPGTAAEGMVVKPPEGANGSMPVIKPGELPGQKPGTEAR